MLGQKDKMSEYQEATKNQARRECLATAVSLLTESRPTLPLARRSYVTDVRNYLLKKDNRFDVQAASQLHPDSIQLWEKFYDGLLQAKTPADLKVAYLAGPNPENDLNELMALGVLPENVWAFEADGRTYDKAVIAALKSRFPYLKLFKGTTSAFLSLAPVRFDLVYLDFCGPMPSRSQKNLFALFSLLQRHALNSPGILISNTAFPSEGQDKVGWSHLTKLVTCYLYPKAFLETDEGGGFIEGPICSGLDPNEFLDEVQNQSEKYYSQFLTRLIMDISSVIVPYQSFAGVVQVMNTFFRVSDRPTLEAEIARFYHFEEDYSGGNVVCDPEEYPLLWTIAALHPARNSRDVNFPDFIYSDPEFCKFASLFLRQLSANQQDIETVKNLETVLFLLSEGDSAATFYTPTLIELSKRSWSREMYQFCDLVLFHQLKELLVRQVAVPYHYNVEKSCRWRYQAKEHQMFLDLSVLDECRYVYDWMPTMDMLASGMDNPERQLIFRFALDALNKHRRWYNSEFFSGTAIVDQFQHSFEAKELNERKEIQRPQQGAALNCAQARSQ